MEQPLAGRPTIRRPTSPPSSPGPSVSYLAGGHPPRRRSGPRSPTPPGGPTSTNGAAREHMRSIVRRLYDPMYRHWFRVEWDGLEKIPTEGGALLIANHAGAIPSDAPAIMHGIETELGRPVYGLADYFFRTIPVSGTMWSRTGGVPAHPDNAYRILHDQQQLALVFPEGTKATSKTYADRYRLRRFGRGGFVEIAMRAGVPDHPHRRGRGRGVHAHPVPDAGGGQGAEAPLLPGHRQLAPARARSATSPTSRPSSSCGSSTRSPSTSSRASTATRGAGSWTRPSASGPRMQDTLHDMLRERRSVWFG